VQGYEVKLPLFEGPFDLLLFFIERDELDIYDIPIAKITDEFNQYIHQLEALNMEVASEFILVAATLIRIKAKMLLPRQELDEEGNTIDPRADLVKHLLEYKKFKEVSAQLMKLEEDRISREQRGNVEQELLQLAKLNQTDLELQSVDLYKLLKVYEQVMRRFALEQTKPKHVVVQYPYTLEGQKEYIKQKVAEHRRVSFEEIVADFPNRIGIIFNFLAILELIQSQLFEIVIGEGFNNFWLISTNDNEKLSNRGSDKCLHINN
jgi:segregation and condensation protein A